ncbi:MAG: 2,3-bisphosphoglycerate-independent phosphoglycerate mutase, partial [Deltaproteobacteria bacterium]
MSRVCLIVMDGWGINQRKDSNAVLMANLPNLNRLSSIYPFTSLDACGLAVGLPQGQMGNSEVGHLTIGSGRVIYQDMTRITRAVETNGFVKNPVLAKLLSDVKNTGAALHIMGLVSDGGVHSHINHLFAILDATREAGL